MYKATEDKPCLALVIFANGEYGASCVEAQNHKEHVGRDPIDPDSHLMVHWLGADRYLEGDLLRGAHHIRWVDPVTRVEVDRFRRRPTRKVGSPRYKG